MAPREGRPFYLRMVSQHGGAGQDGVAQCYPQLVARVDAAGGRTAAGLGGADEEKQAPPAGTAPLFSA